MAVDRRLILQGAAATLLGGWRAAPGTLQQADPFPLGRTYRLGALAGVTPLAYYNSTAGRVSIAPGESGSVTAIMVIGDSLISNSVNTLYTVTQSLNHNFNSNDGGVYQSKDPMLGTPNGVNAPFLSCPMAPLGDNIITGGFKTRAIMVPASVSSTIIADWAVGGFVNGNLSTIFKRLTIAGLTLNGIMWHGGPNDTNINTSQAAYLAGLNSVIATLRQFWPSVPILVGICTQASGTQSAAIQAAQAGIVNHANQIWAGVNSDAYPSGNFQDGTHFSVAGRTQWATDAVTQLHAAGVF